MNEWAGFHDRQFTHQSPHNWSFFCNRFQHRLHWIITACMVDYKLLQGWWQNLSNSIRVTFLKTFVAGCFCVYNSMQYILCRWTDQLLCRLMCCKPREIHGWEGKWSDEGHLFMWVPPCLIMWILLNIFVLTLNYRIEVCVIYSYFKNVSITWYFLDHTQLHVTVTWLIMIASLNN